MHEYFKNFIVGIFFLIGLIFLLLEALTVFQDWQNGVKWFKKPTKKDPGGSDSKNH